MSDVYDSDYLEAIRKMDEDDINNMVIPDNNSLETQLRDEIAALRADLASARLHITELEIECLDYQMKIKRLKGPQPPEEGK